MELITQKQYTTIRDMLIDLRGNDGAIEALKKIKARFGVWTIAHLTTGQAGAVIAKLEKEYDDRAWSEVENSLESTRNANSTPESSD